MTVLLRFLVGAVIALAGCSRERVLVLATTQSVATIVAQSKGFDADDFPVTTQIRDIEIIASAHGSPPMHFARADVFGVFVGGYLSDFAVATVSRDASWEGVYALWQDMVLKLQSHGFEADESLPGSTAELEATLPAAIAASGGIRMYFHGDKHASAKLRGGIFPSEGGGSTVSVTFVGPMYGFEDWTGEAPPIRWPPSNPSP
jgi:hypothetical protein